MIIGEIAEYGIAIFSIGALVYIVRLFVCFIKNHMTHSTESQNKLTEAIHMMLKFLERSNK